jgi:hypothetical protein
MHTLSQNSRLSRCVQWSLAIVPRNRVAASNLLRPPLQLPVLRPLVFATVMLRSRCRLSLHLLSSGQRVRMRLKGARPVPPAPQSRQ